MKICTNCGAETSYAGLECSTCYHFRYSHAGQPRPQRLWGRRWTRHPPENLIPYCDDQLCHNYPSQTRQIHIRQGAHMTIRLCPACARLFDEQEARPSDDFSIPTRGRMTAQHIA